MIRSGRNLHLPVDEVSGHNVPTPGVQDETVRVHRPVAESAVPVGVVQGKATGYCARAACANISKDCATAPSIPVWPVVPVAGVGGDRGKV